MSFDEMTSSRLKNSQNVFYRGFKWAVDHIAVVMMEAKSVNGLKRGLGRFIEDCPLTD